MIAVPVGDGPIRTLLGSSRTETMADASPAGPQLVYVTDRRDRWEIWITSLAEGWDRPLFDSQNILVDGEPAQLFGNPIFSADGKRIAFAAKGASNTRMFTAFVSGGNAVRATSDKGTFEGTPTWSPDGTWLAFTHFAANTVKLSKIRPGSGEPAIDLADVCCGAVPQWSPTGEWIAATDHRRKLMLFSTDGKASREMPGDVGPFTWARDGKRLYQVRLDPPALRGVEIATARERKLRDLPGLRPYATFNPGQHVSLSADGKDIIYTVNRPRSEIWILEGLQEPRRWWQRLVG